MHEQEPVFAEIILPLPLEKTFHYRVPRKWTRPVQRGMRVEVPFGKRTLTGYVSSLHRESAVENTKDILSAVETEPVITDELFSLARWMSRRYVCSLGEALATVLPPALRPPRRDRVNAVHGPAAAEPRQAYRPALTPAQERAVAAVKGTIAARSFGGFLLHGVTSSGKTEVYLSLIEETVTGGREAVFLLPEISLTPQFVAIVRRRFPGIVGLWHSRISYGEKYRTWDAARRGKIKIMLGARSAVFAPFPRLGLIIVDEEHEPSYKQEQKPSYQTRDMALERARLTNAAVVLGSATPSLESYYAARQGHLRLIELAERVDARSMPPVKVIDTSALKGSARIISAPLAEALTRTLARREQAIIFLNRRGFSPGITCQGCGDVWECPRCSISLVYHRTPEGLRCHYCDYGAPFPERCPSCGERRISVFGAGTQKVEEELKKLFPQARVVRLDRDTASKQGVYERTYEGFRKEEYDILLGTQMVVKGFDFPRVTLVGVVDADTALYLPDFRSAERTFQLITQGAGRSGRSDLGGDVIVQSRHSDHYALLAAREHDYRRFYEQEIAFRRELNYPPFCRLMNIVFRGRREEKVREAAQAAGAALERFREGTAVDILGPTPAARAKLHNLFRWQVLLKGELDALHRAADEVRKLSLPSGTLVSIDVDPQDTL